MGACVFGLLHGPDIDDTIHESPQGLVYLTRISDRSFQAAHPIKIDPTTIGRVLSGVLVREDQSAVQNFFTGAPDARRAFSEGEVAYLAPLISEGLRRAASDQQVGFRIAQIGLPRHAHNTGGGVGSQSHLWSFAQRKRLPESSMRMDSRSI